MILQALHDLYERLASEPAYRVPQPGYSLQKIAFKVILNSDGELFEIADARQPAGKSLRPRQLLVPGDSKPSGSGINPCFLWDNGGYMLGYKPQDKKPERTRETFEHFRDRHLALEREIDAPAFSAVCRFLERWDPDGAPDHPALAETAQGFGVFQLAGHTAWIHEDPAIRRWWQDRFGGDPEAPRGQCLITGADGPLARLHPKVKGVSGGKSDATIAGFNEPAYESYGKTQSYNAPTSEVAAFRYVTALNALLDGPASDKHRILIGGTTVAFWTDRPTAVENVFASYVAAGSGAVDRGQAQDEGLRQKLEAFLRALRLGREAYGELGDDPDRTHFFLLGLSSNAARISVRFFHHGTLGELLENLRRHHRDIGITPQPASGKRRADPEFPPPWMLLRQTARETKDIPSILEGPLLRAIVAGTEYPAGLSSAVVRRIHADRTVNYVRASILKGYLVRNLKLEVSMSLDKERIDPPYLLGRLFAVLEKTQLDAHEPAKLNKTLRDSFYSSASANPGTVFPRLLRTYQHHLSKLEGGRKVNREKLVQEILDPLNDWPIHLGLAGQGLFAIGYYHQFRDLFTKKTTTEDETTENESQ